MKKQVESFVVMADAIVGRGHVYRRGQVVGPEQVGEYAEALVQAGGLRRSTEPISASEPIRNAVSLC
ncbi:MAG: hypothetical protein ACO1SV_01315 [Fimbriimonas sp.]